MPTADRQLGLIQIHLAAVLVGFTGLFGKLVPVTPGVMVCGRALSGSLAAWLAIVWTRQSLRLRSGGDLWIMLLSGAVLAAHWFAFFRSIQLSSVGVGLLSFSSFPLFVTLLEPLVFRERMRPVDLWVAMLVMVGLALITPTFDFASDLTRGVCWGVLSGFTYALLSLLNRSLVRNYHALTVTFHQLAWAALFSLPSLLQSAGSVSARDAELLVVLGVVFTMAPQALIVASLGHLRAQLVSVIICLEPVYGIAFAWLLLDEVLAPRSLLGGAFIAGAVLTSMRRPSA